MNIIIISFHYKKNIKKIIKYCQKTYEKNLYLRYEGKGVYIFERGEYYIGQFKYGLMNRKGTIYIYLYNLFANILWNFPGIK